jgi:DNA repair protein RecO (recombination protein O)
MVGLIINKHYKILVILILNKVILRAELELAYIVNSRSYLESSFLLEVFTRQYGMISMVAKGVKKSKYYKIGLLQPFNLLLMSWSGKGQLYTMTHVELYKAFSFLSGKKLFSGIYINELLCKLLAHSDPHIKLFDYYQNTIDDLLSNEKQEQEILRIFEKNLLIDTGYALPLIKNLNTGEVVKAELYYNFDFETGPTKVERSVDYLDNITFFKGSSLLALYNEKFSTKEQLMEVKKLMRMAIQFRLGMQKVCSRELLRGINRI